MQPGTVYGRGGPTPRPPRRTRVRTLDPKRRRNIGVALTSLAVAAGLGCCCGGVLFAVAMRLLDW
jgi:hypothetical protein